LSKEECPRDFPSDTFSFDFYPGGDMSHEFESGFVVRDAAWHGLAKVLREAPTTGDAIREAQVDWEVATVPVEALIPKSKGVTRVIAEGWKAVIRTSDNSVFSIVSDKYQTFQNVEAFSFFDPLLANKSCTLESAGSLRGGKFVWVLAKIAAGDAEISSGDQITSYLLLSNAHDGSRAITVAFTPIRVVCWNTMSIAHNMADKDADRQGGKAARVLHVGDIKANLAQVQREIDVARRSIGVIVEQSKILRAKQIGPNEYYRFLEGVYAPEREAMRQELDKVRAYYNDKTHSTEALNEAFARMQELEEKIAKPFRRDTTLNKLVRLFEAGPGAEMAGKTLLGAVSAVTHYEEHLRTGSTNEQRLHSSWFGGTTASTRDRAYAVAAAMAV